MHVLAVVVVPSVCVDTANSEKRLQRSKRFETYMTFSYKWPIFERFRTIVYAQESKEHFTREGLVRIVRMAYEMNPASKGKERLRTLDEVTERILRDHTPDTSEDFEVKIWSSPLSD